MTRKLPDPFPKGPAPSVAPILAGSIHLEWKRCGKPNCRCERGMLHGPYFYRRWREGGRLRKGYVSREELTSTILAIALHRQRQKEIGSIRASLKGTWALEVMP
jgi:hypothetical protein